MTAKTIDTLWYTRCPVPTPLGLAAKLGWFDAEFAPEGIAIKSLREVGDPSQQESHYDHHQAYSFRQGGSVPAIWARSLGRKTRVIGLNWLDEFQGIVALPSSGILKPADLKGRRLGLPRHENSIDFGRAGTLRGLTAALSLGRVSEDQVSFVDIAAAKRAYPSQLRSLGFPFTLGGGGYGEQFHALIRGEVDAIFVKGAGGAQLAHQLGAVVVADIASHPDPAARSNNGVPRPITVDQVLIDTRSDLVRRFLARIVDVADWAADHKAEAVSYIARESASAEAWVTHAYGDDVAASLGTKLDERSIAALDAFKSFLFARGFLKQDFDARAWIDPEPLAAVLAERTPPVRRAVNQ
jgi:ABC-type nitrate/sulfonate/bicarbonate transport system substrate-binding protein